MPEDRQLTRAIEKALAGNDATKGARSVHIKAVAGAVFVDGEVESQQQREAVLEVVKGVEGARMVRDRLQINPETRGGGWREPHRHAE